MQILKQSFSVSFNYNVFFTSNLFSIDSSLLEDFFSDSAQDNSNKKLLFVVDDAVWKAHPYLASAIPDYFSCRAGIPKPVEKIIVVTGAVFEGVALGYRITARRFREREAGRFQTP